MIAEMGEIVRRNADVLIGAACRSSSSKPGADRGRCLDTYLNATVTQPVDVRTRSPGDAHHLGGTLDGSYADGTITLYASKGGRSTSFYDVAAGDRARFACALSILVHEMVHAAAESCGLAEGVDADRLSPGALSSESCDSPYQIQRRFLKSLGAREDTSGWSTRSCSGE